MANRRFSHVIPVVSQPTQQEQQRAYQAHYRASFQQEQIARTHMSLPRSYPPPPSRPPDDIFLQLLSVLNANEQSTSARIDNLATTIQSLATQISDVRKETQEQTKQVAAFCDKTNAIHKVTSRVFSTRIEKLEALIGTSYDGDEKKSLSQRLDGVLFAVEEFLERVKDPEAALQPSVQRTYADVHIDPRTPSPPRLGSPLPPELDPRVCHEKGTSPFQKRYMDVATDPRSSTPPRSPLLVTRSTGVEISPTPDSNQHRLSTSRRYSDALTLVEINTEVKENIDVEMDHEVIDTAQVPEDTHSVPEIEKDHRQRYTSPSPFSPNLLPATWSKLQKYTPLDEIRAVRNHSSLQDGEEILSMSDPSVTVSSGSRQKHGSVTSFVESLHRHAYELPAQRMEEEEEGAEEAKHHAFGDAKVRAQHKESNNEQKLGDAGTGLEHEHNLNGARGEVEEHTTPAPHDTSPNFTQNTTFPSSPLKSPEISPSSSQDALSTQELFECMEDGLSPAKLNSGGGDITPVMEEDRSVAALITEAFASLPELNEAMEEISGNASRNRNRDRGRGAVTRREREISAEIALPHSRLALPRNSDAMRDVSPDISFLPSRPSTSTTRDNSNGTLLFEGVDGPVFDSDTDVLDLLASSRSPTPVPMTSRANSKIRSPLKSIRPTSFLPSTRTPRPSTASTTISNPHATRRKFTTSPIYVSSRSLSPISSLSSSDESEMALGNSDSDILVIPVKKKEGGLKPAVAVARCKSKSKSKDGASGASLGARRELPEVSAHGEKLLQLKLKAPDGQSAAVTKVKRRKLDERETKPETKTKQQAVVSAQSVAATKVRKRKLSERGMMDPPLKRAKRQSASGNGKVSRDSSSGIGAAQSSKANGKGKEEKSESPKNGGRPAKAKGIKWPPKMMTGEGRQKFAECVRCFRWYHYGCVGILPADTNIDDFKCPPCQGGGANPLVATKDAILCSRPGCREETRGSGMYFVACILGRINKVHGGAGRKYKWLLKWDGYPVEDATWEDEESMVDPQKLIAEFREAARGEGFPDDDPHSMILLREAVEAGWKVDAQRLLD